MSERIERKAVTEEKMETLKSELSTALEHLRNAQAEGVHDEYAEEMVEDAITQTIGAHGRVQLWLEVTDE